MIIDFLTLSWVWKVLSGSGNGTNYGVGFPKFNISWQEFGHRMWDVLFLMHLRNLRIIMTQKNVFKSTRKVLTGVYFPGPSFAPCFREFLRDWYKYFDLVLEGVSFMLAMLKLGDVYKHHLLGRVYTDYQAWTLQNNTPVLLLYQVIMTIII